MAPASACVPAVQVLEPEPKLAKETQCRTGLIMLPFLLHLVSPDFVNVKPFHKLPGKVPAKGRRERRQLEDLKC